LPEGNNIILIWVFLLAQAGESNKDGGLFITDTIPFTVEDLADEFDFKPDVIRLALKILENFGMIEIFEDVIYIKNWGEYQNIEGLDKIREQTRLRVAKHRNKNKLLGDGNATSNVTCNGEVTLSNATEEEIEIELERDIDIDIYKDIESKSKDDKPSPPLKEVKHKYGEYNHVRLTDKDYNKLIEAYGEDKILLYIKKVDEYVEQTGKKYKNHYLTIKNWISKDKDNKQPSKTVTYRKENKAVDYEGQREFDPSLEAKLLGWDE
jgi:predicted phage replisome organizer